jgi:hypothetical protein
MHKCFQYRMINELTGGGSGIRTHGTLARTTVFETAPFDRSGIPPRDPAAPYLDGARGARKSVPGMAASPRPWSAAAVMRSTQPCGWWHV